MTRGGWLTGGYGGLVQGPCPLCDAWQVEVRYADVDWPLAGLLVEHAIGEHVAEHTDDSPRPAPMRGPLSRRPL